jgi:hypothetical protein
VAATAAKKTIKADKEEIEAEANAMREKITKGTYKYAPVNFAFEVKNGTLRLAPTVLAGQGAETKVNGYIELASLKLDSEWALSLTSGNASDVPPVNLLFTGTLNNAGEIAPTIDTAAIEAYLTMRRMQEDVERLETLDVTGRTQPPIDADEEQTSAMPVEPVEPLIEAPQEEIVTAPEPEQPPAETQALNEPLPPPPPSSEPLPTAMQLLEQAEAEERRKAEEEERKRAAVMPAPSLSGTPAPTEPAPDGTSTEAAATPQSEASPEQVTPAPQPKAQKKRRQTPSARRREAPDDWRKGIPFLGGG